MEKWQLEAKLEETKAARVVLDYLNYGNMDKKETNILLDAENEDILPILRQKFIETQNKFIECEVGCVVGTHSGTQACGVFFIEKY